MASQNVCCDKVLDPDSLLKEDHKVLSLGATVLYIDCLLHTAVSYLAVTATASPRVEVKCSCWTSVRCRIIARTTT